jgi:hypothetical protein
MNRFYDIEGDVSTQIAPWESVRLGLDPSVSMFRLERALRFRSDIAGGDIIVPVGFTSDLASIPQIAWSVFADPDAPFIELGSWPHDYLYTNRGRVNGRTITRDGCDHILAFEAMPELGAKRWQQNAVYLVLRYRGASHWGP